MSKNPSFTEICSDLLKTMPSKKFRSSDNYLDELVYNFQFDKLSSLKEIGFDITTTIQPETRNIVHVLSNLKGTYYKENNTDNLIKIFHFYKDNGTSFDDLNKYFNEIIFNLPVRAIKELTTGLGFYISESHKNNLIESLHNNYFDNYSLYKKDGIDKLEAIIAAGISFVEMNQNEYLLQSALEQDGGINFVKYLLNKGASLTKLQKLHNESLINYVVKNTYTINNSMITLLLDHGIRPDNNTLNILYQTDSSFIKKTSLVEKMVKSNHNILNLDIFPGKAIIPSRTFTNPPSSSLPGTYIVAKKTVRFTLNLLSSSYLNNISLFKKLNKLVNRDDKVIYANQLLKVLDTEGKKEDLLNFLLLEKGFNFSSFLNDYDKNIIPDDPGYISEELFNKFKERSINQEKNLLDNALSKTIEIKPIIKRL